MEIHGNSKRFMGIYKTLKNLMEIHGNSKKSMEI